MSECTQCPHSIGDSYQRDCDYPDCMGGYDIEFYDKISGNKRQTGYEDAYFFVREGSDVVWKNRFDVANQEWVAEQYPDIGWRVVEESK